MFHNTLKIFLLAVACAITSSLNASTHASSSIACVTPLNNQSKQELIEKLDEYGIKNRYYGEDFHWPERKKIISTLITDHEMHPNEIMSRSNPPLYEATRFDDLEFTEFLLKHNADPNTYINAESCEYNKMGNPQHILLYAATKSIAELLFRYGAQLDKKSCKNVLHKVVRSYYDEELIPLYIKHGAQINQQDDAGMTPLEHTIKDFDTTPLEEEYPHYSRILLQNGALILTDSTRDSIPITLKELLYESTYPKEYYPRESFHYMTNRIIYGESRGILKKHHEESQQMLPIIEERLVPDLANIVNEYLVESKKSYQDLETENESDQD